MILKIQIESFVKILNRYQDYEASFLNESVDKVKRAVADSENHVKYGANKDGINDLMLIYFFTTEKIFSEIEKEFHCNLRLQWNF